MPKQILVLGPTDRARKLCSRLAELGILFDFKSPARLPEKLPASLAGYEMIVLSEAQARPQRKRLDEYERSGGLLLVMPDEDWKMPSRFERVAFAASLPLNNPAMFRRMEAVPDRAILDRTLEWVMEQTDLTWTDVLRYHLETLLGAYDLLGDKAVLARAAWKVNGAQKTRPVISNCDHVACIYPILRFVEITGDKKLIPFCKAVADEFIAHTPRYHGVLSNYIFDKRILRSEIAFQVCPALARLSRVSGRPEYRDLAVEQILLSDRILNDRKSGLWRLGLSEAGLTPCVWGRGAVFSFRGLVDTLEELPADHPSQRRLRPIMLRMARGLVRVQEKSGQWCQLFHDISRRPEGSATSWSTAALAKGIRLGLLDKSFRPAVEKGWKGTKRMVWDGLLTNMSQGTTASPDPDYFRSALFNRPTYSHYALLAAVEYTRLKQS